MNRRITVRGIVLHEGKLLCAQLKPYKGSVQRGNSFWSLPGGGLEPGEALTDGVAREMLEETGIKPVIGNLMYIQQFAHNDTDFLEFFFHITNGTDYLNIDLAQTTHGLEEIEKIAFVDPTNADITILPEFLASEDLVAQAAAGTTKIISRL